MTMPDLVINRSTTSIQEARELRAAFDRLAIRCQVFVVGPGWDFADGRLFGEECMAPCTIPDRVCHLVCDDVSVYARSDDAQIVVRGYPEVSWIDRPQVHHT